MSSAPYIALDRGYISQAQFGQLHDLADKAVRQLANLIAYLKAQPRSRQARAQKAEPTK